MTHEFKTKYHRWGKENFSQKNSTASISIRVEKQEVLASVAYRMSSSRCKQTRREGQSDLRIHPFQQSFNVFIDLIERSISVYKLTPYKVVSRTLTCDSLLLAHSARSCHCSLTRHYLVLYAGSCSLVRPWPSHVSERPPRTSIRQLVGISLIEIRRGYQNQWRSNSWLREGTKTPRAPTKLQFHVIRNIYTKKASVSPDSQILTGGSACSDA